MVQVEQGRHGSRRPAIPAKQVRMVAGGAIGTLMEYYDYYLYGLASAAVFPTVFFPSKSPAVATLESLATFAFGFLLRPVGGLVWGYVGDRYGRKAALMITVIGMGIATTCIGLIPPSASIGIWAPIILLFFRLCQGLFVGGEMGPAASLVVEHAPPGRRGLFGALLITGAGIANLASAGFMAGLGGQSFFMTWGWRIPFLFAVVLMVIAILLRRKLEDSEEYTAYKADEVKAPKRKVPLFETFRHPKNAILGIVIGLIQSIAGYVVLTFGLAHMVTNGVSAEVGFIGTMIVGAFQIFIAPTWGLLSDKVGRRKFYIGAAIAYAVLIYPAFALFSTHVAVLIWLGMVVGFIIGGVGMQATLQTLLCEMFDVEARVTGVNVGYQFSNTLGGFAPFVAAGLTLVFHSIWPVIAFAVLIALAGIIGTAYASIRPDVTNAPRLHDLDTPPSPTPVQ